MESRLKFTTHADADGPYYEFEGTGRLEPLLRGSVLPKALVAPTAFEPVFESAADIGGGLAGPR